MVSQEMLGGDRPALQLERRPAWLESDSVQKVIAAFQRADVPLRFVGGCVRDTLLEAEVNDLDATTPASPQRIMKIAQDNDIKAIPTGLDHGTVTLVSKGQVLEVTTLRRDVETDGRHAQVAFTDDWTEDAKRRDFTINALYLDGAGRVYDPVGGLADLAPVQVRFIGNPEERIKEDYLRILRFFRFVARFDTQTPDSAALAACAALQDGIHTLSAERITDEMKRILKARAPERALGLLADSKILTVVFPFGFDVESAEQACAVERALNIKFDEIRRFAALCPQYGSAVAQTVTRLRFSKAEAHRVRNLIEGHMAFPTNWFQCPDVLRERLYYEGSQAVLDDLVFSFRGLEDLDGAVEVASHISSWQKPDFPVSGHDVMALGVPAGPNVGRIRAHLEKVWVQSDFGLTHEELLMLGRGQVSKVSQD